MELTTTNYDIKEHPMENSAGVHKIVCEYDSVGNILKIDYQGKDLKPARNAGFNCSARYKYNELYQCKSVSFYDEKGNLTYNQDGIAVCQYTYDKSGNIVKYEFLDKDGKTLVNSHNGYAVEDVTYDALGNIKTIHNYNSSMKPCMTSYGYYAKEYVYDDKTNFTTEEKYYNANGGIIKIEKYTYDSNGNRTAYWTVNGSGHIQGEVSHYEYDNNNRIIKAYCTNLYGKKVSKHDLSYCETNFKYDDRGNIIEETFLDVNGKPACDVQKTYKRIKRYDERNNYIYEKNLGKDDKPIHGSSVNPEAKVTYDERGNITSMVCLDGYGNPYICTEGFHRLERKFNDKNLISSECYKDTKGNLVKHKSYGFAKVTYAYDTKRNRIEEKYFSSSGHLTNYVTYNYNDQNSLTEACMYNAAGKLDDSKAGFSRLRIFYASDGKTPVKKTYYRGGSVLAWQSYDSRTGKWGNLNF